MVSWGRAAPAARMSMARKKALLVSVSDVPNGGSSMPLPDSGATAGAMAGLLSWMEFEQHILAGPSATRANILSNLGGWLMDHDEDSVLVFAVSAHGAADHTTGNSWFFPYDLNVRDPVTNQIVTNIDDPAWRACVNLAPRARLFCVFDSCRITQNSRQLGWAAIFRFLRRLTLAYRPTLAQAQSNLSYPAPPSRWIELRGCAMGQSCYPDPSGTMGHFTRAIVEVARKPCTVRQAIDGAYDFMGRPDEQVPEALGPELLDAPIFR